MRTDQEIIDRLAFLKIGYKDFFGFQTADLVCYLSFDAAKTHLKDGVAPESFKAISKRNDRDAIISEIRDYMPFAWEKANDCRGLSAGRSIDHFKAYLWLLGEDAVVEQIGSYSEYGKPQLRAICEKYGIDWRSLDDGRWRNIEGGRASPAPAETIQLNWMA